MLVTTEPPPREVPPLSAMSEYADATAELNGHAVADEPTTWEPVDLTQWLEGDPPRIEPTVLRRGAGELGLFYAERINGVHARDGVGKSWLLAFASAEVIADGGNVLWLDLEDPGPSTLIGRLRGLGVDDELIAKRLAYVAPVEPSSWTAIDRLRSHIDSDTKLIVIDSVGEAHGLDAIDENSDSEVTPWIRRVLKPLAELGPAVVCIDHLTNNGEDKLRPAGSKRKRAAITGAQYLIEELRPFSKTDGGAVRVICAKDRHGCFRRGDHVATITMHINADGMTWSVTIPNETTTEAEPDKRLELAASKAVWAVRKLGGGPVSMAQIELKMREQLKAGAKSMRAGIEYARDHGYLTETAGPRNSRQFELGPEAQT